MKRILCILSSTALMFVTLGGCQSQEDTIQDLSDGLSAVDAVSSISSETELFSERDLDPSYEEASAVQIELNGTEAAATGDGGQTQTNSAPEDSGNFDSEADDNAVSDGDAIQDIENVPQTSSSIEDVSLNDEVTVQIGDDGTAEAITLSSSAGSGITVVPGDRPVDSITES